MVTGIKTCSTCKEAKSLSQYFKSVKNRDGLQAQCKECQMVVSIRYAAVKRKARREALVDYKGRRCEHCLGVFPTPVYDLHHKDPSIKEFQFNQLASHSWEQILTEADKCILLCANCHRIEHHVIKETKE